MEEANDDEREGAYQDGDCGVARAAEEGGEAQVEPMQQDEPRAACQALSQEKEAGGKDGAESGEATALIKCHLGATFHTGASLGHPPPLGKNDFFLLFLRLCSRGPLCLLRRDSQLTPSRRCGPLRRSRRLGSNAAASRPWGG